MKNGFVECPSCKESVSPRLWHESEADLLTYRAIDHICPLCGVTMYQTGGEIRGSVKFIAKVLFCVFLFTSIVVAPIIVPLLTALNIGSYTVTKAALIIIMVIGTFQTYKLLTKLTTYLFSKKVAGKT